MKKERKGEIMPKADIKSMTPEELRDALCDLGQPGYRAGQVFTWLHSGVSGFGEMTNLPKTLRETLEDKFYIANVEIVRKFESRLDETKKYLYRLHDGECVESVLMKYKHGYSVCISTQVGCRMGCSFCASGLDGLCRSLTASEMLSQVQMAGLDNGVRVSNIVLMGMGEPLDNYDNTVRFLDLVSHPAGLNIGLRHISLSTSGVVPGIYRLAEEKKPVTLSISLHAPNDEIRSRIMAVNRKWGVEELLKACRDYIEVCGRRISFEYAMIEGVNDSDACARELAARLRGMRCHVNLIPANPVKENGYKRPDARRVEHFSALLNTLGINTTVRRTLGADIDASCGQLRRKYTASGRAPEEGAQP